MYDCSSFSTSMSTLGNCQSFQILAISSECVVISHYGFNLHFPRVCFSEKAMAPHSSTLAWRIPWTEEPGRLQTMGSLRVGHDWAFSLSCIGEGNGNPLQCSCLENFRDGEAWWLLSMESHRVGHNWSDSAAAAAAYLLMDWQLISFRHLIIFCRFMYLSLLIHSPTKIYLIDSKFGEL